jgi:type VI secretion system secreted protein VgrG
VSGKTTSWYTHEGGAKVYAANGPLSLRAHTDELQILADRDVTVISVNDEIHISASTKIELIAGQSSITLEGANIEFKTPGAFTVKGSGHAFLGGSSGAASFSPMPDSRVKLFDEAFVLKDEKTGALLVDYPYRVVREDNSFEYGRTDDKGQTHVVLTHQAEALRVETLGD